MSPLPPNQMLPLPSTDAVLRRPIIAFPGSAPECSSPRRVEFHDRRRGHAAFRPRRVLRRALLVLGQRTRPMNDPDMVLRIDRDAADLAHDPVVGQRLGPERIDLEFRDIAGLRRCERSDQRGGDAQCGDGTASG